MTHEGIIVSYFSGSPSEEVGAYVNVAENGVASQSSTGWDGVADRAIDGDANPDYWG